LNLEFYKNQHIVIQFRLFKLLILSTPTFVLAQVGIETNTPNASAQLDVSSTTKGFLPPRMTSAQRSAIGSPTAGLMVYQTDATAGLYYYTGSAWIYIINATTDVLPVTNGGTGVSTKTGTGSVVLSTSPSLTTPSIGVATASSINKVAITAPTSSATLTIADGKTLTASNSITMAGTDGTTMTFPSTNATIARTDAAQTFTGIQTFSGFKLSTGAVSGKILTSDASGNASWQTGAVVVYTEVHTDGSSSAGYATGADFMILQR
jgi:hypothetical protein